ncbi:MAG: T9SS type A sorting domain-containing protein, partial [Bacteroidota bacterium]
GGTNVYYSTTGFQDSLNTKQIGGFEIGGTLPGLRSYLNHHPDQHDIIFYPSDPNKMLSANDGGVFRTNDNTASTVAWTPLNNGYLTTMLYTVAVDHATTSDIILGGTQDNGTWYNNNNNPTANWLHIHGGDGSYCAVADSQKAYYFSVQLGEIQKAIVDANGNKTAFTRIDPIGGKGYLFINPFTLDPNNNNIMYLAGGKYLWRNNDLSGIPLNNTWDSISTNWTQFADSVPLAGSRITSLAVCKTPANRVYYGTDKKKIYRIDNANVGTPTPVDITSTATSAIFPNTYMSCIATDPTDGNKLIAVFSSYNVYSIFYSTDGGTSWSKAAGNLEQNANGTGNGPSIRWISILPVADGKVYLAATSTGLYATDTLNGVNTIWVQQGTNIIGNVVCDMIDTRISDGLVVVGTHANGIYTTNITSVNDIVTIKDLKAIKNDLQLSNYPNPLSQTTTIEFTLSKRATVNLQVWDVCGRLTETLVDEVMPEGKHTVQFDRKNLKAGMYYYSLTVENRRRTNKMVIVQ